MKPTVAGFALSTLDPQHKLNRVLASALREKSLMAVETQNSPLWNADFFGLNTTALYQSATETEQTQILNIANQGLLAESYFIEKAGVGYMAKMTLLAETTEERMLYALFSADEATHLAQLKPLVPTGDELGIDDPFLQLLESLLETADRDVLLFVIQVVLEGWGLSHYRNLSKFCCNPELSELFHSFLQAEAKHHGAGVTLFAADRLSAASRATIVQVLADFLQMVRVGPQRVLGAVDSVLGGLSRGQAIALLTDLKTEAHSATRLNLLRQIMWPVAPDIVEALAQHNLFVPLPAQQCVIQTGGF